MVVRPQLRFMIGDKVVFRRNDDDLGSWHAGTVEELWYRNAKWPDKRPSCPYRVAQKSPLSPHSEENHPCADDDTRRIVLIEQDTDSCIRVLKHNQRPMVPLLYGDVPLPQPKDPLHYLYKSFPKNELIQVMSTVTSWKKTSPDETMEMMKQFSDGSGLATFGTPTIFIPNIDDTDEAKTYRQEPVDTIIGYIVPRIAFRRPLHHVGLYNEEQLFDSIFPPPLQQEEACAKDLEKNIRQLETQASSQQQQQQQQQDSIAHCQQLLNLGDAHLFLFRSMKCNRDFEKACKCYRAAGYDWNHFDKVRKDDFPGRPEGLPEALCAQATILHYSMERFVYACTHNVASDQVPSPGLERPMLDVDFILREALRRQNSAITSTIGITICMLGNALRMGWFCQLAFLYGVALNKDELCNTVDNLVMWEPPSQKYIGWLRDAHRNHQIQNQIKEEKLAKACYTQFGIPSAETISAFAPKAADILRSIPVDPQLDLHVSFFEQQTSSSPVCILLFCPNTLVTEILQLPDEFQLFPFSDESFQWAWLRIAFIIHLGLKSSEIQLSYEKRAAYDSRIRPGKIKVKCVGGDLQFASFLQLKCLSMPGTLVELLEVDPESEDERGLHEEDRDRCSFRLESGIRQLEHQEATKSVFLLAKLKQVSGSILANMRRSFFMSTSERKEEASNIYRECLNLKSKGNNAFKAGKFALARKMYRNGLSSLAKIRNPSTDDMLQLIGALLSNYAACGLEIAKTQEPAVGVLSLKEVVAGCEIALMNVSIRRTLSHALLTKLRFRQDLASSRQPCVDPSWLQRTDEFRGDSMGLHLDIQYNLRIFSNVEQTQSSEGDSGIDIALGKDAGEGDTGLECPVCGDDFATKLATKHVVRLQCRHFLCAKCFLRWKEELNQGKTYRITCVTCRQKVDDKVWDMALEKIVEESLLESKLKFLPLDCRSTRLEVFRSLLVKHHLDVDATSRALDEMLYLNQHGHFWLVDDLTWQEKGKIYRGARRPVLALENEEKAILRTLDQIVDTDSNTFKETEQKLKDVREKLQLAKLNAGSDIFANINSQATMGRENSHGEIQLDFHGLHVKEAKERVESLVVPVLPVVGSILLITGRGLHSSSGSTLKPALRKYVKLKYKGTLICEDVKENAGALRLQLWGDARID